MIITVRNMPLRRQAFSTSCWISTSHYLLQYLGVDVTLHALHGRYYNPDPRSLLAMSGAGHPKTILGEYAFDAGRFPAILNPQSASKEEFIRVVSDSIRDGLPVIAGIRSQQVQGFGHAIVITAIDDTSGTIGFKDPGTGPSPRPFGVDVRTVPYGEFVNGFSYRYARTMMINVYAYCSQIIYLRPVNEMSLFA